MASELVFGAGAVGELGRFLSPRRPIVLVTGGASFAVSGAEQPVLAALAGRQVRRVAGVVANPDLLALEGAFKKTADLDDPLVLAVGGGSVIDLAKLLSVVAAGDIEPAALVTTDTTSLPALDLIAIPTTSGSGAERTHFAVLYVDSVKHSIAAESMRPGVSIVDPALTHSMSPQLTASSGLDALAHAVESMWSVHSTVESRLLACTALQTIWPSLHDAVVRPTPELRRRMSIGATRAGAAIDQSQTTAPHALAYHLTATFGVPHGSAVALTLGAFIEFNGNATPADLVELRGMEHLQAVMAEIYAMLGVADSAGARKAVTDLVRAVGATEHLDRLGLDDPAVRAEWADAVNLQRLATNPRRVLPDDLSKLLGALP